jgi:hypothetical protein
MLNKLPLQRFAEVLILCEGSFQPSARTKSWPLIADLLIACKWVQFLCKLL